jgi:hypothetical protein
MTKLNQIIAIEKGVKSRAQKDFTTFYHLIQKTPLLEGISRTYFRKDDDGDDFPAESKFVQTRVEDVLAAAAESLTRQFDVTLTKEVNNAKAVADVKVDGNVLIANAPVTYLLFLEKQLTDIRTFVSSLPTLDPASEWEADQTTPNIWVTPEAETVKTKKVPKILTKAPATDKHPAQVEVFHEDIVVGTWKTKKFSGAVPASRVEELTQRVDTLIEAVKFAREEANGLEITDSKCGDTLFGYLFA